MPTSLKRSGFVAVMSALIFMASGLTSAYAESEAEAGRAVMARSSGAVIAVKAVLKVHMSYGGEGKDDESETETLATVVDPSGLAVLSFTSVDPSRLLGGIMKQMGPDGSGMEMTSDIGEITMLMPDGTEVPAKMVLRDADLDLAFIMPKEKCEKPFAFIDLSAEGKPDVMDTVFILNRMDKSAGRVPSMTAERIESVITTPRKYYVADSMSLMARIGAPVFTVDGKVAGFSLIRVAKTADKPGAGNFLSGNRGLNALGIIPVVLPVGDVSATAKLALESLEEEAAQ